MLDFPDLTGKSWPVMSLLPAYFGRKRDEDLAPPRESESEPREDVFNLIPPRASDLDDEKIEKFERFEAPALKAEKPAKPEKPQKPEGPQSILSDLSRLSIDNDNRLYWDGKPVEVRRRLEMSRRQVIGAALLSLFIVAGAVGAIIQGTAAAHEWACKVGWTKRYCEPPAPAPRAMPRTDIPA